jgi:antitoxin (DNA-binding transcriptional repressor) of toxin-antitoxin stability system
MKVIGLKETNLDACVSEAQHERIVITRNGKPVALVVGVAGLDAEQLELGSNPAFWELITQRRRQRNITRAQLEKKVSRSAKSETEATPQGLASAPAGARKKRSRRRG